MAWEWPKYACDEPNAPTLEFARCLIAHIHLAGPLQTRSVKSPCAESIRC